MFSCLLYKCIYVYKKEISFRKKISVIKGIRATVQERLILMLKIDRQLFEIVNTFPRMILYLSYNEFVERSNYRIKKVSIKNFISQFSSSRKFLSKNSLSDIQSICSTFYHMNLIST